MRHPSQRVSSRRRLRPTPPEARTTSVVSWKRSTGAQAETAVLTLIAGAVSCSPLGERRDEPCASSKAPLWEALAIRLSWSDASRDEDNREGPQPSGEARWWRCSTLTQCRSPLPTRWCRWSATFAEMKVRACVSSPSSSRVAAACPLFDRSPRRLRGGCYSVVTCRAASS